MFIHSFSLWGIVFTNVLKDKIMNKDNMETVKKYIKSQHPPET